MPKSYLACLDSRANRQSHERSSIRMTLEQHTCPTSIDCGPQEPCFRGSSAGMALGLDSPDSAS